MTRHGSQPDDFDRLLAQVTDEDIEASAWHELFDRFRHDTEARRRYFDFVALDVLLADELADRHPLVEHSSADTAPGAAEADRNPLELGTRQGLSWPSFFLPDNEEADCKHKRLMELLDPVLSAGKPDEGDEQSTRNDSVFAKLGTRLEAIHWRAHPARFLTVAATLTLLFWFGFYCWMTSNVQQTASSTSRPTSADEEVVAAITASRDCCWANDKAKPKNPQSLIAGQRLELTSGIIEVVFVSGARVVLEGPGVLTTVDRGTGRLSRGRLVAQVSKRAVGFAVETPAVKVADLGTSFGINVQGDGTTEVHVFEGLVEVAQLGSQSKPTAESPTRLTEGQALRFRGAGEPSTVVLDESLKRLPFRVIGAREKHVVLFQDGLPLPKEAGGDGETIYSGTRDVRLREYNKDYNTGAESHLVVGQYLDTEDDDTRILIDFDYNALATYLTENNLRISSVALKLYQVNAQGTSATIGQTVDVFKAKSGFHEGTGTGGGQDGRVAVDGESTWNRQRHPAEGWADGGPHGPKDFDTSKTLDTVTLGAETAKRWHTLDVTGAFAADGSDLADHPGFVLVARVDDQSPHALPNAHGGRQMLFFSSEADHCRPAIVFRFVPALTKRPGLSVVEPEQKTKTNRVGR